MSTPNLTDNPNIQALIAQAVQEALARQKAEIEVASKPKEPTPYERLVAAVGRFNNAESTVAANHAIRDALAEVCGLLAPTPTAEEASS